MPREGPLLEEAGGAAAEGVLPLPPPSHTLPPPPLADTHTHSPALTCSLLSQQRAAQDSLVSQSPLLLEGQLTEDLMQKIFNLEGEARPAEEVVCYHPAILLISLCVAVVQSVHLSVHPSIADPSASGNTELWWWQVEELVCFMNPTLIAMDNLLKGPYAAVVSTLNWGFRVDNHSSFWVSN